VNTKVTNKIQTTNTKDYTKKQKITESMKTRINK
jgi:hypothetical protein